MDKIDCEIIGALLENGRDTADLDQTLRALKADLGAAHTRTRVILEESVHARQHLP